LIATELAAADGLAAADEAAVVDVLVVAVEQAVRSSGTTTTRHPRRARLRICEVHSEQSQDRRSSLGTT
jgi:hypothetical protein